MPSRCNCSLQELPDEQTAHRDVAADFLEGKSVTQLASAGNSLVTPQLIVPAYFHPAVLPREWEMLLRACCERSG